MASLTFQVPENGLTYVNLVKERCNNFISSHIWSGIDKNTLRLWLNNFVSEEEKYFAACILDNLIYRSKEQTSSMIYQLLTRSLPDLFRVIPPGISTSDFFESLNGDIDPNLRFVPIINDDDPTQSGFAMSRLIRTMGYCNKKWIVNPNRVKKLVRSGLKVLVFIDDFLGTGEQFKKVADAMALGNLSREIYIVYAPLAAHETGVKFINSKFPDVKVVTAELLTVDSEVFRSCFDDGTNTPEAARAFYKNMLQRRKIKGKNADRFVLDIAYSFEHGVPNNSIRILHHRKKWNQLFIR